MSMKRRRFLGNAVSSAAGTLVTGALVSGESTLAQAAPSSTDPTEWVPLGKYLKTSRLGIGTGMRGGNRESNLTRRGQQYTDDMFRYCYDQGIRFFDVADLYGSHPYLARAMKDKPRESYTIGTKIWFHPGGIPEEERPDADVVVKRFLKELNTDYIDLVQIHCMMWGDWPKRFRKQMDLLAGLKEQGLIKAHGISCHALSAIETAADEPWVDVIHARINPFGTKMDGPPEKVVPLLNKVHAAGKGVIGMKLIGEGALGDDPQKREESVRFVTNLDCVDVMIVGFEETKEVDEFKRRVGDTLTARATQ